MNGNLCPSATMQATIDPRNMMIKTLIRPAVVLLALFTLVTGLLIRWL